MRKITALILAALLLTSWHTAERRIMKYPVAAGRKTLAVFTSDISLWA